MPPTRPPGERAAGALDVRSGGWVVVELEADEIDDASPVDAEYEMLVRPTAIISVTPVDDDFLSLLDEKADFFASFDVPAFDD